MGGGGNGRISGIMGLRQGLGNGKRLANSSRSWLGLDGGGGDGLSGEEKLGLGRAEIDMLCGGGGFFRGLAARKRSGDIGGGWLGLCAEDGDALNR